MGITSEDDRGKYQGSRIKSLSMYASQPLSKPLYKQDFGHTVNIYPDHLLEQ